MGSTPLSFREQEIVLKAKLRDRLLLVDGQYLWEARLDGTTVHLAYYPRGGRPSWRFHPYRTVTEAREAFEEAIVEVLRKGYQQESEVKAPAASDAALLAGARTPIERGLLEEALRSGKARLASANWVHDLVLQGAVVRRGFGKGGMPVTTDTYPDPAQARLAFARAVLAALHEGYRPHGFTPPSPGLPAPAPARPAWQAPAREASAGLGAEVQLRGRAATLAVRPGGPLSLDRALGEVDRLGVERLTLRLAAGVEPAAALESMRTAGLPGQTRALCLFAFDRPEAFEAAFLDASPLTAWLSGLEALELQAGGLKLGRLLLPRVRSLSVRARGLSAPVLAQLAALELPMLERLTLWFGSEQHGADVEAEDVVELLRAAPLPRLRHLALLGAGFADALCAALPGLPVVAQLLSLDLSYGAVTDAGAEALAGAHLRLHHLEAVRLDRTGIGPSGRRALAGARANFEVGEAGLGVECYLPMGEAGEVTELPA